MLLAISWDDKDDIDLVQEEVGQLDTHGMGGLAKEFSAAATVMMVVAKKQSTTDNGGVGSGG
eukprot:500632-Ditylum_brightwellii.AAC.1